MASKSTRPARSIEEVEDEILKRVLLVTLIPSPTQSLIYLELLAAELLSESKPLRLSSDTAEQAIMARLQSEQNPVSETPLLFLVQSYRRSLEEQKKVSGIKDSQRRNKIISSLQAVRDLLVSYIGIVIQYPDSCFVPEPPAVNTRSHSPKRLSELTDPFLHGFNYDISSSSQSDGLPPGLIDDLVTRFEGQGLEAIFEPIITDISSSVRSLSLLGNFTPSLRAMTYVVKNPALSRVLVGHPKWNPTTEYGRTLELESIMGPFLHISAMPDMADVAVFNGQPDVRQQCFSNSSERRPADIASSVKTLQTVSRQLWEGLHEVFRHLLKQNDTREPVLQYFAALVNLNASRNQIQMNYQKNASHGTFINLGAIMLKLCEPFLDPYSPKMDRIDALYVLKRGGRVNFSDLTGLHSTSDEIAAWVDQRNLARQMTFSQNQAQREHDEIRMRENLSSSASTSSNPFMPSSLLALPSAMEGPSSGTAAAPAASPLSPSFHFICECFFITARVLNLGIMKVYSDLKTMFQRSVSSEQEAITVLEGMRGPGQPADLERQILAHKSTLDNINSLRFCYEISIKDRELIQSALSFYRLLLVWIVKPMGGFHVPAPVPCHMDFAAMPEHLVDDAFDALILACSIPHSFDGIILDEFMNFILMFMGSPLHIKNPYLRAKMVEVLQHWMPSHCPHPGMAAQMSALFEGHPLALHHLAPNLLKVYVDVEFTGGHSAFYDKFSIRFRIAELLEYLWGVASHRDSWIRMSQVEQSGFYLKYVSLLINDSIFLLDDSLEKIPKLGAEEAAMANREEWLKLSAEERRGREEQFHRDESTVKWSLQLANSNVRMLEYTTEDIVEPFLLPEMVERVAAMLNYFLLQLVGPKRKALRVSNPEKYEFRPKQLLSQIVTIYVHLSKGDSRDLLPRAISVDGRSFRSESFQEASAVLRAHHLLSEELIVPFLELGKKAELAAAEATDVESQLGEIPDEFLDPIQYTLMVDPVILPSGNTVDRSVILRHLLSDPTDPFSRAHCTPEMLKPDVDLKGKIDVFISAHKR